MKIIVAFLQAFGILNLVVGAFLCFGFVVMVRKTPSDFVTVSQIMVPLFHLLAGFGLWCFKDYGRYMMLFLSAFYFFLGILITAGVASLTYFLPVVPLIEYIPKFLLEWSLTTVSIICFFVLPVLLTVLFNVKNVATQFDSGLEGHFSWRAPFGTVLSSAVIFAFCLIVLSETQFFYRPEARVIFGFSLTPFTSIILRYFEFYLPLIIVFGFYTGNVIVWFVAVISAVYFWLPYFLSGFSSSYLLDIRYLVFGAGWMFVLFAAVYYWRFFWQRKQWAHDFETNVEARKRYSIIYWIASAVLVALVFSVYLFRAVTAPREEEKKEAEPAAVIEEKQPLLRLEGTSIDSQGSYAVINSEIVKVGGTVEDYQVEAVQPHRVLLSLDGEKFWLDDQGKMKKVG